MASLEFVRTYLDDVLTITNSTFSDHLEKLEQVLKKLDEAGLTGFRARSHICDHFYDEPPCELKIFCVIKN